MLGNLAKARRASWGRTAAMLVVLVAALAVLEIPSFPVLRPRPVSAARPYNVVILMSDDQRWDTVKRKFMPHVYADIKRSTGSRVFKNAFVHNPVCCPSRASFLTGRYSHHTGVWGNRPPHGGFSAFDDRDTIAVDLDAAGYRTALIGKYLNGYDPGEDTYVPPGWDRWFAIHSSAYYNYGATTDRGTTPWFGDAPEDYATRVLGERARRFAKAAQRDHVPFFLYLSYTAPHLPSPPAPQDIGRFPPWEYPMKKPPSFNVVRAGDPDYIRSGRYTSVPVNAPELRQRQLEAMYSVDRSIGRLLRVLPPHTIVVFMSDNGFLWGEHRWLGKRVPYNESLRIPMVVTSLDGTYTPGWGEAAITLNVDLRPSLQAAVGVPLSQPVDGLDWSSDPRRSDFVIEKWHDNGDGVPSYCGVRELGWMYVRYRTGEEGLYNETADPYELHNRISDAASNPAIAARRQAMRRHAKQICDPPPPGYRW